MAWVDHGQLKRGYFGAATSSLLWCEEKWLWSPFIAEPVNTFTNIFFLALSLWGAKKTYDQNMPRRFITAYLGCAGVSIGSFAFHATLKYEMQLLDELPMIYTMAIFLYCVFESTPGYGKPKYAVLLPASLLGLVTFVTVAYLINGNPVFHQAAYGLMQVLSTVQVVRLLHGKQASLTKAERREISMLFFKGSTLFISAFAIWNIDNICCSQLRAARRSVGYPWAILLEGHGWWHLGTGLGGYLNVAAAQRLMLSVKEGTGGNVCFAHALGGLPHVERVKPYRPSKAGNGPAKINGYAKSGKTS